MKFEATATKHDDDDVGTTGHWLASGENASAPVIAWASPK